MSQAIQFNSESDKFTNFPSYAAFKSALGKDSLNWNPSKDPNYLQTFVRQTKFSILASDLKALQKKDAPLRMSQKVWNDKTVSYTLFFPKSDVQTKSGIAF